MFCCPFRLRKKKSGNDVEVGDKPRSSQLESVNTEEDTTQVAPDTPDTSVTTVSATRQDQKGKAKKASWWRRLFCHKKKTKQQTPVKEDEAEDTNLSSSTEKSVLKESKDCEAGVQEASPTPDIPVSTDIETGKKQKKKRWWRLRRKQKQKSQETPVTTDEGAERSPSSQKEDVDTTSESTKADSSPSLQVEDGDKEAERSSPSQTADVDTTCESTKTDSSASPQLEDGDKEAERSSPSQTADVDTTCESTKAYSSVSPQLEDGDKEAEKSPPSETVDINTTCESTKTDSSASPQLEDGDKEAERSSPSQTEGVNTSSESTKAYSSETLQLEGGDEASEKSPPSETVDVDTSIESTKTDSSGSLQVVDGDDEAAERSPPSQTEDVNTSSESTKADSNGGLQLEDGDEAAGTSLPSQTVDTDTASESTKADSSAITDILLTDAPESWQCTPSGRGGSPLAVSDNIGLQTKPCTLYRARNLSSKELVCLGLPNLAQTCYMNSTLQGLLTLTHFVQEVRDQQKVWDSHLESKLFRGFVEVELSRFSKTTAEKKSILAAFKMTVAEINSEFEDDDQKDALDFLSCVLDKLRSLSISLYEAALNMGITYTCPVNAHIAFQMLSTRTCKGCGMQSMMGEDYLSLSLDLVPGGSVSQCLQEYLKENQLEYRCECGARESSQRWSFLDLPNVLIFQLKRFRFTKSFNLKKVNSPVILSRELVVNPESSITKQTRYSLVSIISHLGSSANSGHYICDGAHREQTPGDATDCWLTYNDLCVRKTTGTSVCRQRQRTAYLLFYEKLGDSSSSWERPAAEHEAQGSKINGGILRSKFNTIRNFFNI